MCGITLGHRSFPSIDRDVEFSELTLKFRSVSDGTFAAICSALAELRMIKTVTNFDFPRAESPSQDRLSWVIYALCCGPWSVPIEELSVTGVGLTKDSWIPPKQR